ncbi:CBS domain-containing protein [Pseudonocardia sp. H11422]|uniref:CBS domain-containing protein n=1 Tax=Pseudonocardia sp. H11422 TaxID=2835866 RepID=UPI001BDD1E5A|nr:CBS domain-containing protein [Pseudonocardia sp. H11422]
MRVCEVMSSPAVVVTPDTPVKQAALALAENAFTSLPVVDVDSSFVGLVSEPDLLVDRFPPDPRIPGPRTSVPDPGKTVGDVMHTDVLVAHPQEGVADLVTVLRLAGLRAVPVVDGGTVVGMVTYRDLVRALARDDALIAADVTRRLGCYAGPDRWAVAVSDGEVTLTGEERDPIERHTVGLIAEAIIGVTSVRFADPVVVAEG